MVMNTGDKIRGIRTLKGFTQDTMADLLKISRNAYSEIERNITDVSESRIKQIADALGVSPNDIHNFEDKRNIFFENCNGAVGMNNVNTQTTIVENKDLQHKIEILELQIKNQQLEIEKLKIEKDKAELEVFYLKSQKV
jgi:transcriptional regulator with XRE-family HTH domain